MSESRLHPSRREFGGDMPRKSISSFIQEHKDTIDSIIRDELHRPNAVLTNEDRRGWISHQETLYNWAKREGVNV